MGFNKKLGVPLSINLSFLVRLILRFMFKTHHALRGIR